MVSEENVTLIRSALPGPEIDLVAAFADSDLTDQLGPLLHPEFTSVLHMPGGESTTSRGLEGFRRGWLDWLTPWASYRIEIEEIIDVGDGERVVTVVCDYARREPGAPEVPLKTATLWTVRDGLIACVEFYPGGRAEALKAVGLAE